MKRIILFIVMFVAVGAAGYFWIQNKDTAVPQPTTPNIPRAEDVKFSSVQEQGSAPELKNQMDYKVSGNQIKVLAAYGKPVGECPDKTLSVKYADNNYFIYIRATSKRSKDYSQSILSINVPGSADGKTIKVSRTEDCDEN